MSEPDRFPMKWHRFQMVIMIIGSVITMIGGITYITGYAYTQQGFMAGDVYQTFPGLKACDVVYGIATIALGVFQLFVRNQLNQFRVNAPRLLTILYIAAIAIQLIYMAAASSATGVNLFTASTLGSVGGTVLFLFINSVYYSRRRELFTH